MLDLARNGYTKQEVINQLHGKNGSRGLVKIRYDLLNRQDVKLGELMVQSGRISMNSLAEIKRTASFELTEQEARDVDWLNDRIRPVFCLKMPEIRKTYKAWSKIDASFSRSSIAYLSDGTQVPANTPRFEAGKFGKAVMVEEGTTNLITNPDCENDIPKLNGVSSSSRLTAILDGVIKRRGNKSLKLTTGDLGYNDRHYQLGSASLNGLTPGATYTFSFYVYIPSNSGINLNSVYPRFLYHTGAGYAERSGIRPTAYDTWQRIYGTFTPPSDADQIFFRVQITQDISGASIYVDDLQLEQKSFSTSFIDATRSAESLTIPTARVLNPQEGTVECWVYVDGVVRRDIANNCPTVVLIHKGSSVVNWIWLHHNPAGTWVLQIRKEDGTVTGRGDFSDSLTPDGWHYFAIRWNAQAGTADLFHNGVKRVSLTGVAFPAEYDRIDVGHRSGSSDDWLNSLIDDLRISNRARTEEEILAAYQSNEPLPIDQWTTAKFSFDDKLSGGDYFTLVDRDISAQWIEWPLGVFLLSSPTRKDENRQVRRSIEAYDSSLILKEDKFTDRYVIEAGTKYTDAIINILNAAGIWKINIIDHPGTLAVDREFEIGTTKLYAVNELLAAINYTSLWVDENGYFVAQPYVLPSNRDPEYEYRTNDLSVIHPGSTEELDLFAVPNKWVRYVSNPDRAVILRSEYTNDLSTSPTSTINRGRTIVDIDHVEDIYDQATLDEYVKRIAYNASQVYGKFEFTTALMPHHSYYNCLFVEYDPLGISHKYMELSWTMDLHANGVMRHSCRRVIQI